MVRQANPKKIDPSTPHPKKNSRPLSAGRDARLTPPSYPDTPMLQHHNVACAMLQKFLGDGTRGVSPDQRLSPRRAPSAQSRFRSNAHKVHYGTCKSNSKRNNINDIAMTTDRQWRVFSDYGTSERLDSPLWHRWHMCLLDSFPIVLRKKEKVRPSTSLKESTKERKSL